MLIDTGKVFSGKVEFNKPLDCPCENGRVSHNISWSSLCHGYRVICDHCGRKYLVALASSKLYSVSEAKSPVEA